MSRHDIHLVESFTATGTFAHAIGEPRFHTTVAEEMTASLDDGVFEVGAANGADGKILGHVSIEPLPMMNDLL